MEKVLERIQFGKNAVALVDDTKKLGETKSKYF